MDRAALRERIEEVTKQAIKVSEEHRKAAYERAEKKSLLDDRRGELMLKSDFGEPVISGRNQDEREAQFRERARREHVEYEEASAAEYDTRIKWQAVQLAHTSWIELLRDVRDDLK